jgi:hypothetical protein
MPQRHFYGRITAIESDNGLMKISLTNNTEPMDFYVDPRSRFVQEARTYLHNKLIACVIARTSQRCGKNKMVAFWQIVDMPSISQVKQEDELILSELKEIVKGGVGKC